MSAKNLRRLAPRLLIVLLAVAVILGLSARGDSVITRGRLERSLPETFSNLYVQQAEILGRSGVTVASLGARATCDKGGPDVADSGPGADWTCLMSWIDPNVPLPDGTGKFELNVHSNACYTATGPSKIVGLLEITDTQGNDVPNPIFEFDSCFDPGSSDALIPPSTTPASLTLPMGRLVPDEKGEVVPELRCSGGAAGGCAGTLTATVGKRTIGTVRYQLPPGGTNTFPFALADTADHGRGAKVTLTAAPLIGTVRNNSQALAVANR